MVPVVKDWPNPDKAADEIGACTLECKELAWPVQVNSATCWSCTQTGLLQFLQVIHT